jgi:hypothetical protein
MVSEIHTETYICERFIYFQDWYAYSASGKYVDQSREYTQIAHRHMNVEIRTEAVQFPEKEYINGIFLASVGTLATILFSEVYSVEDRCI